MMVFAFFLLALLALTFVVAPALVRSVRGTSLRYSEQAQASSRAWYEERLQAVEQDVLDEEDKTQLAEELAAVLLAVAELGEVALVAKLKLAAPKVAWTSSICFSFHLFVPIPISWGKGAAIDAALRIAGLAGASMASTRLLIIATPSTRPPESRRVS